MDRQPNPPQIVRETMIYNFTKEMRRTPASRNLVQTPQHFQELIRKQKTPNIPIPRKIREWDLEPDLETIAFRTPDEYECLFEDREHEQFEFETIL